MKTTASIRQEQPVMWELIEDVPIKTTAGKRAILGHILEEAIAPLFHASRFLTDGTSAVCPDLLLPGGAYGEVKALTKEGILFRHRLEKDLALVEASKHSLYYFYVRHTVKFEEVHTRNQMGRALMQNLQGLAIINVKILAENLHLARKAQLYYRTYGEKTSPAYRFSAGPLFDLARSLRHVTRATMDWRGHQSVEFPIFHPCWVTPFPTTPRPIG